jgi:hypothetical protein
MSGGADRAHRKRVDRAAGRAVLTLIVASGSGFCGPALAAEPRLDGPVRAAAAGRDTALSDGGARRNRRARARWEDMGEGAGREARGGHGSVVAPLLCAGRLPVRGASTCARADCAAPSLLCLFPSLSPSVRGPTARGVERVKVNWPAPLRGRTSRYQHRRSVERTAWMEGQQLAQHGWQATAGSERVPTVCRPADVLNSGAGRDRPRGGACPARPPCGGAPRPSPPSP